MKTQIKGLSATDKKNCGQYEWRKPNSGLYETMIWKLWDGRVPAGYVGWDSGAIRDAFRSGKASPLKGTSGYVLFPECNQRYKISDITPLQHLTKLRKINLNANRITDLSPLKDLMELT